MRVRRLLTPLINLTYAAPRNVSYYGKILKPWLCFIVYLWALDFQASYAVDFTPFMDSLEDAIMILWSLVFWALVICFMVALVGLLWRRAAVCRANEAMCRICCLGVSAMFLVRWMDTWSLPELALPAIQWPVILAVALVYFVVRQRRRRMPTTPVRDLPSWQDWFSFAALPLLCASIIVVGIKITKSHGWSRFVSLAARQSLANPRGTGGLPNVIVIVLDSLRAQSLSFYESSTVSTPSLEQFAQTSSVYLEMHSNSTTTTPSMTALLTGEHPLRHGRLTRLLGPRQHRNNLLHILRSNGYRTAAITSNIDAAFSSLGLSSELVYPERFAFGFLPASWLRKLGVHPTLLGTRMYWDMSLLFPLLGFPDPTAPYGHIETTLGQAKELLERLQEPFSLFIHVHEPHESQLMPSLSVFVKRVVMDLADRNISRPIFYAPYDRSLQPIVDVYKEEYDDSVHKVDIELGKFFNFLGHYSWLKNSLIIVTGDHGESFERGYLGHGEELYENSTRVPLIIRFPRQSTGERVAGLTQTIDIAPTILRAVGIPLPDWMEGQPLMQGRLPERRSTVAINFKHPGDDGFYPLPTRLAIWRDRYKLIVTCARDSGVELYDLKNDPAERNNLAAQRGAWIDELKHELKGQVAKQPHEPRMICPNL